MLSEIRHICNVAFQQTSKPSSLTILCMILTCTLCSDLGQLVTSLTVGGYGWQRKCLTCRLILDLALSWVSTIMYFNGSIGSGGLPSLIHVLPKRFSTSWCDVHIPGMPRSIFQSHKHSRWPITSHLKSWMLNARVQIISLKCFLAS